MGTESTNLLLIRFVMMATFVMVMDAVVSAKLSMDGSVVITESV